MTKVLILAAGKGERLRPLTNNIPKSLVRLVDKTILERQISILKKAGISKIHIATGYLSNKIKLLGYTVSVNKDYEKTNMIETMFSAVDFFKNENEQEDLIISYGDIVYEYENLYKVLSCKNEISTMIDLNWKALWSLRMQNPLKDAETLVMDKNKFITDIGKKTNNYNFIQGQYTGLTKIRADKIKEVINFYYTLNREKNYLGKRLENLYMTDFLQLLIDSGQKIKAVLVKNGWLEIDTVNDLNLYENLHKKGKLEEFYKI